MYKDAPGIDTAFSGSWHNVFVRVLSGLGVPLVEREVSKSEEDSFLEGKDKIREIPVLFPLGTFGYGYKGNAPPVARMDTVAGEYSKTTKLFMYHFQLNGREYTAQLLVIPNGTVQLTIWDKSSDRLVQLTVAESGGKADVKKFGQLLDVVFNTIESGRLNGISDQMLSYKETYGLLSSSSPLTPQLTQHDIASLLSSSNPSHVFWSPLLNKAAVKDSHGWYVASFCYLNSGWTLDWFTLSATQVKSNGHKYIRYGGSGLIPVG